MHHIGQKLNSGVQLTFMKNTPEVAVDFSSFQQSLKNAIRYDLSSAHLYTLVHWRIESKGWLIMEWKGLLLYRRLNPVKSFKVKLSWCKKDPWVSSQFFFKKKILQASHHQG